MMNIVEGIKTNRGIVKKRLLIVGGLVIAAVAVTVARAKGNKEDGYEENSETTNEVIDVESAE